MLFDLAKGLVPALVATQVAGSLAGVLTGGAAMVGHARPLFLGFAKGGKAVATAGGTILGVAPIVGLIAAGVWIVVFAVTRYASVASIISAASLPLLAWGLGEPWPVIAFGGAAAAAVIVAAPPERPPALCRHRDPREAVAGAAARGYCSSGAIVRPESLSPVQ